MTFWEFTITFFDNAHILFLILAIIMTVVAIITTFVLAIEDLKTTTEFKVKRIWKVSTITALATWIMFCVPKSGDLWQTRVNLIKLDIASPNNVNQGVKRVNEVAKEMECKYLDKCN